MLLGSKKLPPDATPLGKPSIILFKPTSQILPSIPIILISFVIAIAFPSQSQFELLELGSLVLLFPSPSFTTYLKVKVFVPLPSIHLAEKS